MKVKKRGKNQSCERACPLRKKETRRKGTKRGWVNQKIKIANFIFIPDGKLRCNEILEQNDRTDSLGGRSPTKKVLTNQYGQGGPEHFHPIEQLETSEEGFTEYKKLEKW